MRMHPARWLRWSPLALAPFVAAWWLGSGSLEERLASGATDALKNQGLDWARVAVDGRDATISGDAPSKDVIDAAVRSVAGTYGIRTAVSTAAVVPPPPPPDPPAPEPEPLTPPAVNSVVSNNAQPEISGTWPEKLAKTLAVNVAERIFKLGSDAELTSDGNGVWKLKPASPMADGHYDISATITDAAGRETRTANPGTLVIDTIAPPAPEIMPFVSSASPDAIKGTWAEGDAVVLKVSALGNVHELGSSPSLTSDGSGNWSLKVTSPVPQGTYGITVETADAAGNWSSKTLADAIQVDSTPPNPPTIDTYSGSASPVKISGTWAEGDAVSLKVTAGDKVHQLGNSAQLASDGAGHWTLTFPEAFPPGRYDIVVESADLAGNVSRTSKVAGIVVEPLPAHPTIVHLAGNDPTPRLTGTWDAERGRLLRVSLGDKTYELGRDSALSSPEKGKWVLESHPLTDGIYDVVVETLDGNGNSVKDDTVAEVVVDITAPTPPTIDKWAGNVAIPRITGGAAGDAARLAVSVGGKTYASGQSPALTLEPGGRWSLAPEPLPDGYHDVVALTADLYGNESRDTTVAEVVVDTTPPAAPTVERNAGNDPTPTIKGTWPAKEARKLAVAVGGKTYVLGNNAELAADGDGVWTLQAQPLADGYYDVVATATDEVGNASKDATVAEVVIDTTPPVPPTVNTGTAFPLSGSFAPGDTKQLTVSVAGKSYELGKDGDLTAKDGIWSLNPPVKLGPGVYDVAVSATDAFGNRAADTTTAELYIADVQPPPAPPPSPPPEPEMKLPSVDAQTALAARPMLTGTWAEGAAKQLKVSIGGDHYVLGQSEDLKSDGAGRWTLRVPKPFKDGTYDVAVETEDGAGNIKRDETTDELIVDAAPPATPTVRLSASELSPASVSGRWAEGDAVTLSVSIAGNTAALGSDRALHSDGQGNWTLDLNRTLDPGSYDVVVATEDARGRVALDQTKFEILVKGIEEAKPVPQPAPVDCQSEFNTLLIVDGIRFESDSAVIQDGSRETIAKLAAIAAQCPDKVIEIGGHTDSTGSAEYNQALSESRAVAVLDAMEAAGVNRQRMIAKGYGEDKPLASNETEEGRMVNRRIEFTLID